MTTTGHVLLLIWVFALGMCIGSSSVNCREQEAVSILGWTALILTTVVAITRAIVLYT